MAFSSLLVLVACGGQPSDSGDTADSGGDTADTGGAQLSACDGVVDPGHYTTDSTTTFTAAYDDGSAMIEFADGTAADWQLIASAGVTPEDDTHWSVNLPADNWAVLLESSRDATAYYRTWTSGWGASPSATTLRAFRRDDWAARLAEAGWTEDASTGILAVMVVDPTGLLVDRPATVRVADGSYAHAFTWTSVQTHWKDTQPEWTHIPHESSTLQTDDAGLYFSGVCPGMNEVEVDGPCGACTLGREPDSPTRAPVLVEADTVSLAWFTCDHSCL